MTWKILAWAEEEVRELLSKGLELVAEEIVDAPATKKSRLACLPLREWGFAHCPAIPYWVDEYGDPDLKHILATVAKLNGRGEEGVPTAYRGLSTAYTIAGQEHDAYAFLYGRPRPGSGDDPPKGSPAPNLLPLDDPRDFTLPWTTYEDVYRDSQDLVTPFVRTLTEEDAATESFWPTIASFGLPYNLLVLGKVDARRATVLERDLGAAWAGEDLGSLQAAGLLYEIDMSILASVGSSTAFDGTTRFAPATVTVLKQDPESKALTPVAVRVWTEDGPAHVYTAGDKAWRYALQAAKSSITVWGIWLGHVYHWHIVTAAMQMTMYNHLPDGHRLYQLLQPQSQSLIDFDFVLLTQLWGQIAPPTPVAGYMPLLRLLDRFAATDPRGLATTDDGELPAEGRGRTFFDDDPRAELAARGLEEKDFTVVTPWDAYPVVGYLLDIWDITGEYVTAVVHDMYPTNEKVAQDEGLQRWMKASGHPAEGNVRGLPQKVEKRDELAKVLTSILYRVTVHGAGSLNPAVNPVLSFVSNFPPCLQTADIPEPGRRLEDEELLELLPHTGTVGGMTTFYYTFVYSQPYARLIPSEGVRSDAYFSGAEKSCNDALFAYREAIAAFVGKYLVAWNDALERIRGTAGSPPPYAADQAGQWPRSIEI